jgi:predicted Zn-dependent protease
MDTLQELENFINEFNTNNDEDFTIDSLRIDFSKQHKKENLEQLGNWKKLQKNSNILHKLKKRLLDNEITSVLRLENYNIYYYNSNKDAPRYRTATMVIFGLKQYHKAPPPHQIVTKIISILKNITNIDLCIDLPYKANLEQLKEHYYLKQYITKDGVLTDTHYINNTRALMIEKVTIYNKAFKNSLGRILWRIEATISIPNIKYLALPLYEFKQITDLAKGNL